MTRARLRDLGITIGNLPPGLEVLPHSVEPERLQLRVEWTPPPSAHEGTDGGPSPAAPGGRGDRAAAPPPVEARPPRR